MPFTRVCLPAATSTQPSSPLLTTLSLLAACNATLDDPSSEPGVRDTQLSSSPEANFDALGALNGRETYVTAMSANGDVVVGFASSASGDAAFRWSEPAGLETLEGTDGRAQAISPDGSFVVGSVAAPDQGATREARLWPVSGAFERLEGPSAPEGGPLLFAVTEGQVVLDDGRVYGTCLQLQAYGEPLACRYDAPDELALFGLGQVYAADAAGNFAGTRQSERHAPFKTVATFNGETLPYPDEAACGPISGCQAAAYDFARAGAPVVGTALLPLSDTGSATEQVAFVYDAEDGTRRLPGLSDGSTASGAFAVTPDGRVIAGFGSEGSERVALVWLDGAPITLAELGAEAGIPAGFILRDVRAVSDDGRVFAGNGTNAAGSAEGYRLALPSAVSDE